MAQVSQENIHFDIPNLNWDLEAFKTFERSYDKERDIFFVYKVPKEPAMSKDIGGHFWIRFNPETGNVVGLEFEDFEKVFLVRYPELSVGWPKIKPSITKRVKKANHGVGEYVQLLIHYVQSILKNHRQDLGISLA